MHGRRSIPQLSFHREGGRSLVLGDPRRPDPISVIYGVEGLGAAPVTVVSSPRLAGHGSVLRGSRMEEREIFVPVHLHSDTVGGANELRSYLMEVLSPLDERELTLRVADPRHEAWREIPVRYTGGLEGNFGEGYRGKWQRIGLKLRALDALWRGEPAQIPKQVTPATKPFLSTTVRFFPVQLADSTVAGQMTIDVQGDAPTWPVWTVTPPGSDLSIKHLGTGAKFQLSGLLTETVHLDMDTGRLWSQTYPDGQLWDRVSVDSRTFELTPGRNQLEFALIGANSSSMVHVTYAPRYLAGY